MDFKQKYAIHYSIKGFLTKTIASYQELVILLDLRNKIFRDAGFISEAREVTELDTVGDHIAILDEAADQVVANYMLICSDFSSKFTSDKRWVFDGLKSSGLKLLELSWACVNPKYANKKIWIDYLLSAVGSYAIKSNSDIYFGIVSIQTNIPDDLSQIVFYLRKHNYLSDFENIYPKVKTDLPLITEENYLGDAHVKKMMPNILRFYLLIGNKVSPFPYIHPDSKRSDFFIYSKTSEAINHYKKKLNPECLVL